MALMLADGLTGADPGAWVEIDSDVRVWRLQVESDTTYGGQTAKVELRDADGADSGSPINLTESSDQLSATAAQQFLLELARGDQVRLNPDGSGGTWRVALIPYNNRGM